VSDVSLSTIFAGATFVVIAATAIAAVVQLRHLRASNQLNAMLTIMELWNEPALQDQIAYVRGDLQRKIKDGGYVADLQLEIAKGPVTRSGHPEFFVLDLWEQVGAFMKYGLIDEAPLLDIVAPQVLGTWSQLEPIVACLRERFGASAFENVEYAAVRSRLWLDRHPEGTYPRGTPRMREVLARRAVER